LYSAAIVLPKVGNSTVKVVRARLFPTRAYLAAPRNRSADGPSDDIGRFIIFTGGRTGSELLVSLLSSHPQIACDGELLKDKRLWPDRLIAGRLERARQKKKLAYGFKLQPEHLDNIQHMASANAWVQTMAAQGWKVIRLSRRNRLYQAISAVRIETMDAHYRAGKGGAFEPVAIDPFYLKAMMCFIGFTENQITQQLEGIDYLDISYEDGLEKPEAQSGTVAEICGLLGLEPAPVSSSFVRISPTRLRDMVTNYDEIAAEFRRDQFIDYLTD
jgi:LPS sulfotransferase NodH